METLEPGSCQRYTVKGQLATATGYNSLICFEEKVFHHESSPGTGVQRSCGFTVPWRYWKLDKALCDLIQLQNWPCFEGGWDQRRQEVLSTLQHSDSVSTWEMQQKTQPRGPHPDFRNSAAATSSAESNYIIHVVIHVDILVPWEFLL